MLRPDNNKILFLLVTALLCASIPTPAADFELRVLSLKHRLADDLLPAVLPLLHSGESVSALDSRLVVRASPQTLAEVERLLEELDKTQRNLRISIKRFDVRDDIQDSQGVSGTLHQGNSQIVVPSPDPLQRNGVNIVRRSPGSTIEVHRERRITSRQNSENQNLTVMDGGHAFLHVGESIPHVQPYLALAGNRLRGVAGLEFHDVTSGFNVRPRILADRVQLSVIPRFAFRTNQGSETVDFQELSTMVSVRPGEWTDLGGTLGDSNEVTRQIFGINRQTLRATSRFLIRVDPQ